MRRGSVGRGANFGLTLGLCATWSACNPDSSVPDDSDTAEAEPVECPPPGPFATSVGDFAENVTVSDCSGTPTSLLDLCGQPAIIVNWYGWCASCQDNARLVGDLANEYPDLQGVVVLGDDPLGDPVTGEFCTSWTEAYPSAAQSWADPEGAFEAYGTTDEVLILDNEGKITFNRQTSNADVIREAASAVVEP